MSRATSTKNGQSKPISDGGPSKQSVSQTDCSDDDDLIHVPPRKNQAHAPVGRGLELKVHAPTTEGGENATGPHLAAVSVKSQGKALMGSGAKGVYVMRFRYVGSAVTGAGGSTFAALPWDVSSPGDFSSAAALFSECKVVAVELCASSQKPADGNVRSLIGVDYGASNTAPASEGAVMELEDLHLLSLGQATEVRIHRKVANMQWALTSSPVPGPYAGLYGQFSYSTVGDASKGSFNYLVSVWVAFRGRK